MSEHAPETTESLGVTGEVVDETPRVHYTLAGVVAGLPVPDPHFSEQPVAAVMPAPPTETEAE